MSLLQDMLKDDLEETAAAGSTGAGSVAVVHGSLFGGGAVDSEKINKKRIRMMRRSMMMPEKHVAGVRQSNKWTQIILGEAVGGEQAFDSADVVSKLDAAGEKAKIEADAVPFGLEDENGQIIKVYVAAEQADEFEQALGSMLAGADEDENEQNTSMEIAEVLYELKDKFTIIDVDWGSIQGDEEQEQEVEGEAGAGAEGAAGAEGGGDMEGAEGGEGDIEASADDADLEGGEGGEGGDEMTADTDATSALQSVIDVMKADAEAKKAEADARTAEAKAKEAQYTAQASAHKVRQQEQIVDMETAEKADKDAKAETDQIAKLAKYQHRKAQDAETSLSFESVQKARMLAQIADDDPFRSTDGETEEDQELSAEELAALIMRHLRANGK